MNKYQFLLLCVIILITASCSNEAKYHKIVKDKNQFLKNYQNRPLSSWTNEAVDSIFQGFLSKETSFGTKEIAPFQQIDTVTGKFKTDTTWFQYHSGKSLSGKQEFLLAKNHRNDIFCMVADQETEQMLYLYFFKGDSLVMEVGLDIVWNEYPTVTFHSVLRYCPIAKTRYDNMKEKASLYSDSVGYAKDKKLADYEIEYYESLATLYSEDLEAIYPFRSRTEAEHAQYFVNYEMPKFALRKVGERTEEKGSALALSYYNLSRDFKEIEMNRQVNTVIEWLSNM